MQARRVEGTGTSAKADGTAEQRPAGESGIQERAGGLAVCPCAKDLNQALKVTDKRIQTGKGWNCCIFSPDLFLKFLIVEQLQIFKKLQNPSYFLPSFLHRYIFFQYVYITPVQNHNRKFGTATVCVQFSVILSCADS